MLPVRMELWELVLEDGQIVFIEMENPWHGAIHHHINQHGLGARWRDLRQVGKKEIPGEQK